MKVFRIVTDRVEEEIKPIYLFSLMLHTHTLHTSTHTRTQARARTHARTHTPPDMVNVSTFL